MASILIDESKTTPLTNTNGKSCVVGRYINEQEGWRIVNTASTWEGTRYESIGILSEKGKFADCSGSTNKIYIEAGFPYPYKQTATFQDYVARSQRFREIDPKQHKMQAGDILLWPGHMAIYAPFPPEHPRHNTGVMYRGQSVNNDMYTAFNKNRDRPYAAFNIKTFRGDPYKVYRYYILPGEPECAPN